ncbi:MAG: helix-turn-helix domain-containing protein [Candidatus Omnitrophota bacterium]
MIRFLVADNDEKVKEIIAQMLTQQGNFRIDITKEEKIVRISKMDKLKEEVQLADKITELEDALYKEKQGVLYKAVLDVVERPLIEHALQRTEGNQFKAARLLGINRNTMRSKIRKLGINARIYKR